MISSLDFASLCEAEGVFEPILKILHVDEQDVVIVWTRSKLFQFKIKSATPDSVEVVLEDSMDRELPKPKFQLIIP